MMFPMRPYDKAVEVVTDAVPAGDTQGRYSSGGGIEKMGAVAGTQGPKEGT